MLLNLKHMDTRYLREHGNRGLRRLKGFEKTAQHGRFCLVESKNAVPVGVRGVMALGDEGDAGAYIFEVAEDMRRNKNRYAFTLQPLQLLAQFDARQRIESCSGFVQQQ